MKKRKTYVTIFPELLPVHLKKDVGMLPYSMEKYENYHSFIVCYKNDEFTKSLEEKYNIKYINRKKDDIRDFAVFLWKYGKKIDVLNLYHITSPRNALWIFVYKSVNPKGKVYIKLDADYRMLDIFNPSSKTIMGKVKLWVFRKKVDLYTVESKVLENVIEEKWNIKTEYLPNGVYSEEIAKPLSIEEKKNVFLTVGRLGTEQKATEDLVEGFIKIRKKTDWELWLVGSVEDNFVKFMEEKVKRYPELKYRIRLFGSINDYNTLNKIYRESKVFILPSKWEGFGLVILEALECGNYLILSDQIPVANEISNNGKYAKIIPYHNIDMLSWAMFETTKMRLSNDDLNSRKKWVEENYTWKNIVKKLSKYLDEL